MNTIKYIFGLLLSISLLTSIAFAETQGTVGETSSGSSELDLIIPDLIIITGFADIDFGTYSGTGVLEDDIDLRVSTNNDDVGPLYTVSATGDGASSAFTVARSAGTAHAIAYEVYFNDQTGTAGGAQITVPDVAGALSGQTGINFPLSDATNNANLRVRFLEAALQAAPPGAYNGTLTITVEPE